MPRKAVHHFWRSDALPFAEMRCANDSAACYAPHSHAALSLGAVDDGQSVFVRSGRRSRLSAGDVVVIPAGEVHSCNPEDDGRWSYQMLYLDERWVRCVLAELQMGDGRAYPDAIPDLAPPGLHRQLSKLKQYLFCLAPDEEKEAAIVCFVGDVFAASRGAVEQRPHRSRGVEGGGRTGVRRARAMIEARCVEPLTLDEMAGEAGMSRYHFVRAFAREVGMTPHAWQLDGRIRRARELLRRGTPLAEAALQLGFADQSHFQRAFKQRVAATPGEYRRNFVQD